jgi:D-alanine transaminase/branched-chain amino acid aminotransferase
MYVYLNDRFVEIEKATLHISDLAIQRGYGIFDFFRLRDGVLLYVEDHLDRFLHSANIMHLVTPYSKTELLSILHQLVQKNNLPNAGIRMILTGGYSPDAYQPVAPNFIVIQTPLQINDDLTPTSVSIITHEFVRDIPEAKTINYSMGIWLLKKLEEQKAQDVLYHQNGIVSEFPRSNFYLVTNDNVIKTPEKNALKGVTRKRILDVASTQFQVRECPITMEDIKHAKEAFLTSSTKRIQAIVKMDGQLIGNGLPGTATTQLLKMLIEYETAYIKKNKQF